MLVSTNDKRHTCIKCGRKTYARYMVFFGRTWLGDHYICDPGKWWVADKCHTTGKPGSLFFKFQVMLHRLMDLFPDLVRDRVGREMGIDQRLPGRRQDLNADQGGGYQASAGALVGSDIKTGDQGGKCSSKRTSSRKGTSSRKSTSSRKGKPAASRLRPLRPPGKNPR